MNLQELYIIIKNKKEEFKAMTNDMDEDIFYIIFQPFKNVYNKFLSKPDMTESFLNKALHDLHKRGDTQEIQDEYYKKFNECTFGFIRYYLKGM